MPTPRLQALVLADAVYQDKETGKKVIAGTFNRYLVVKQAKKKEQVGDSDGAETTAQVPLNDVRRAGSPSVYISLTEIRGEVKFQLRLTALEDHTVLFRTSDFAISSDDPLKTIEITLPIPSMPETPGVYALELLCEENMLGACRVTVEECQTTGG